MNGEPPVAKSSFLPSSYEHLHASLQRLHPRLRYFQLRICVQEILTSGGICAGLSQRDPTPVVCRDVFGKILPHTSLTLRPVSFILNSSLLKWLGLSHPKFACLEKKLSATDAIFEQVNKVNAVADASPTTLRLSMDAKATVKVGDYSRGGQEAGASQSC